MEPANEPRPGPTRRVLLAPLAPCSSTFHVDEIVTWRRFADHPGSCCEAVGNELGWNPVRSPAGEAASELDRHPTDRPQTIACDLKPFYFKVLRLGSLFFPPTGATSLRGKIKDSFFPRRSHPDRQIPLCVGCGSIGMSGHQAWQDPHQVVERPATTPAVIGVWQRVQGCPDRPYARWPELNVPAEPSGSRWSRRVVPPASMARSRVERMEPASRSRSRSSRSDAGRSGRIQDRNRDSSA